MRVLHAAGVRRIGGNLDLIRVDSFLREPLESEAGQDSNSEHQSLASRERTFYSALELSQVAGYQNVNMHHAILTLWRGVAERLLWISCHILQLYDKAMVSSI
jgi:hypothetical protein